MKKQRQIGQAAPKKVVSTKKWWILFSSKEQLVGFVFLSLVITTIVWVTFSIISWLNDQERGVLSKLVITGHCRFTTNSHIQQAIISLGLPNTFIDQDVDIIQQEILRLPWIKQASIRKQWPDKLIVHIVEYVPVAYWNGAYLLDRNGDLFNIGDKNDAMPLPKLYGPENTEKSVLVMYKHISDILKQNFINKTVSDCLQVIAMSVNERYSWTTEIASCQQKVINKQIELCDSNQNMKVILGRKQLEERLKRFMLLYPTIKKQTGTNEKIAIIDLRYNNGASVQRHKLNGLSV